ncbi:MAG: nitroreductase family deazaflavin-dependent oxidoreductase [Actinomycetota bacterium]
MASIEGTYVPNTQDWVRDQVEAYERSGGTEARTFRDSGLPIIVVTMRGAKTGHVRKTALMRTEHEGSYALVAGAGGAPNNPGWYYNIIANPSEVFIQDGPTPFRVTAREVTGDERALWWTRAVAAFPGYIERQAKTSRVFPVLVAGPQ